MPSVPALSNPRCAESHDCGCSDENDLLKKRVAELERRNDMIAAEVIRRTAKLHESEWALDRQTNIIRTFFQFIEEGVIVADKNGKFLLFNPAAEKISGIGLRDVGPEQWTKEYGIFYPDMKTPLPPEENPLAKALHGEASTTEVFVRNASIPKGVFVIGTGAPIRNPLGGLVGGVVIFRDITERKKNERELEDRAKTLETEVEKRTIELKQKVEYLEQARVLIEKQNEELKELDRLKTNFVSLASHQLRTPLSTASWCMEMIFEEDAARMTANQKKYFDKAYGSLKRMVRLLDTFLAVSRIEGKTLQPKMGKVDLAELCRTTADEFRAAIEKKRIAFSISTSAEFPAAVDHDLMSIVIYNLFSNAVKYTPEEGNISIEISADDAVGGHIQILVKDTGMGIPESEQPRIFTKLFRASNVLREDTDGNGLGLYLSKLILDLFSGSIRFESEEERGTKFFVSVPTFHEKKGGAGEK